MGRRLAGGKSRLAVSLEDSGQMLVELSPTRSTAPVDSFLHQRHRIDTGT
jgi:hypothetical protein